MMTAVCRFARWKARNNEREAEAGEVKERDARELDATSVPEREQMAAGNGDEYAYGKGDAGRVAGQSGVS
ncbi:hypothetical protein Dda_7694 [Drechslerella dactyloides]|uniref:Uncharacterized protein n=1 Tax=Drechslerella dactyloides TaxID=74499 RepID=A0AAD6NGZ7_DREDA|nr:hypothetical protein Dda_7694 [Drechslerella dactyloides]